MDLNDHFLRVKRPASNTPSPPPVYNKHCTVYLMQLSYLPRFHPTHLPLPFASPFCLSQSTLQYLSPVFVSSLFCHSTGPFFAVISPAAVFFDLLFYQDRIVRDNFIIQNLLLTRIFLP